MNSGQQQNLTFLQSNKNVSMILGIIAGALLLIVPTQNFTGSNMWNAATLKGFGVVLYLISGISAIYWSVQGNEKFKRATGVIVLVITVLIWMGTLSNSSILSPSASPGFGMILAILSGILLVIIPNVTDKIINQFTNVDKNTTNISTKADEKSISKSEKIYCSSCGGSIIENSKFCSNCGEKTD